LSLKNKVAPNFSEQMRNSLTASQQSDPGNSSSGVAEVVVVAGEGCRQQ